MAAAVDRLNVVGASRPFRLAPTEDQWRRDPRPLLQGLRDGAYDVVVSPVPQSNRHEGVHGLSRQPLLDWRAVAVLPRTHGLLSRPGVTLKDLARERLLLSPRQHSTRDLLGDLVAAYESENPEVLYSMAVEGFGVAVLAGDTLPLRHTPQDRQLHWPVVHTGGVASQPRCK